MFTLLVILCSWIWHECQMYIMFAKFNVLNLVSVYSSVGCIYHPNLYIFLFILCSYIKSCDSLLYNLLSHYIQLKWQEAHNKWRWDCGYDCSWLSDVGICRETCIQSLRWSGKLVILTVVWLLKLNLLKSSKLEYFIWCRYLLLFWIVWLLSSAPQSGKNYFLISFISTAKASHHVESTSHQWGCWSWF